MDEQKNEVIQDNVEATKIEAGFEDLEKPNIELAIHRRESRLKVLEDLLSSEQERVERMEEPTYEFPVIEEDLKASKNNVSFLEFECQLVRLELAKLQLHQAEHAIVRKVMTKSGWKEIRRCPKCKHELPFKAQKICIHCGKEILQ